MIFYTGKGDGGTTKLFITKSGMRVSKTDVVFEALGTVDELNTVLGWCRQECAIDWMINDTLMSTLLFDVQQELFIIQAELAGADKNVSEKVVQNMGKILKYIEKEIPKITSFLVPGSGG